MHKPENIKALSFFRTGRASGKKWRIQQWQKLGRNQEA